MRALPDERVEGGPPLRRLLVALLALVVVAGALALLAPAPAAPADPPAVALDELNCIGTDWVELVNPGSAEVSIAGWLLTDDPVDRVPPRDTHRMRFPAGTVLAPGGHLIVNQGTGGFPFGLSCGDDTLRLADATDALVDSYVLPVLASAERTLGRIPDGTGDWVVTLPTPGAANVVSPGDETDDPAWLFDPLQVTEIDLEASPTALAQLSALPTEYVEARITLRSGATTYGPYLVGLRLKGHGAFRPLTGKAAFKVKFGFSVPGQRFHGLKGLTLNNMVQDGSMISEATSSLFMQAVDVPTARVGYAYVRLNGTEYGLYANVETVDEVMAAKVLPSTRHIYEAGIYALDVTPGRESEFEVDEGSTTDISDLEALTAANAGGTTTWWDRMQAVADLAEMTRAWAAEHYMGHWDGYSVGVLATHPTNYYLHSDLAGRFSMILSGTDQTWLEHLGFGAYGKAVLMQACVADATCRALYVDALRAFAANAETAALADRARAIRAVVAPWRARDPRREVSVASGEGQADAEIATMEARPAELAAWLAGPTFFLSQPPTPAGDGGGGGGGGGGANEPSDLVVTGTVTPATSPVGGSHVWRLTVANVGAGTALGTVLDVQLSPNTAYGFSQVTRGSGCVATGLTLHCNLDYLGPAGDPTSTAEVVIGTNVTGAGEVSLTPTAAYAGVDATPADAKLVLRANVPAVSTAQVPAVRPLLGRAAIAPARAVAGNLVTFTLPVTRSDTGTPLAAGKLTADPTVAGKAIRHTESFRAGKARLSLVLPKAAKGTLLRIKVRITATASGLMALHTYTYSVH